MKPKNKNSFRRILAGLCMLGMVCLTWSDAVPVHAAGNAKLTASASTAERGKTVSVTVGLEGNPGIWGLKFRVGYDHSALQLTSVTVGTVFSQDEVVPPESLDKERYVFVATADRMEDVQTDGGLVTLKFQVAEDADFADYPVSVEAVQAITVDGKEVGVTAEDGSVRVQAVHGPNTANPPQKDPDTGDSNDPVLWIVLAAVGCGAVLAYGVIRKKTGKRLGRRAKKA